MTGNLVTRLRESGSRSEVELHEDREEAADRIEELEAEVNGAHEIILSERPEALRLRERIEELEVKVKTLSQAQQEARNEALDEAAELCVQMTGTPRYGRNIRACVIGTLTTHKTKVQNND